MFAEPISDFVLQHIIQVLLRIMPNNRNNRLKYAYTASCLRP